MKRIKLSDVNLLDFGNEIQLVGAVYSGKGRNLICVLPHERADDIDAFEYQYLEMSDAEWERLLLQTDTLQIEVTTKTGKAIVRKSQRQIDQNISWTVFRRDSYMCRYCGRSDCPLTVDHIDLWEEGGASVAENLLSCCKPCNRARGNTPYEQWITSESYKARSSHLTTQNKLRNIEVANKLEHLKTLRRTDERSR